MATRFAAFGRKLAVATLVLLALVSFSPLGNLLLYPLESRFPPWDPSRGAPDGIIVLGGSIDPDMSVAHQTPIVRHAAEHLGQSIAYARFKGITPPWTEDAQKAKAAVAPAKPKQ